MVRRVVKEVSEEATGETLDDSALHWMNWMDPDKSSVGTVLPYTLSAAALPGYVSRIVRRV